MEFSIELIKSWIKCFNIQHSTDYALCIHTKLYTTHIIGLYSTLCLSQWQQKPIYMTSITRSISSQHNMVIFMIITMWEEAGKTAYCMRMNTAEWWWGAIHGLNVVIHQNTASGSLNLCVSRLNYFRWERRGQIDGYCPAPKHGVCVGHCIFGMKKMGKRCIHGVCFNIAYLAWWKTENE